MKFNPTPRDSSHEQKQGFLSDVFSCNSSHALDACSYDPIAFFVIILIILMVVAARSSKP